MHAYGTTASVETQSHLGTTWRRFGGGVAMAMRNDPTGYWSKALGFGFESPVTRELVDDIVDFYRSAGVTSATLQLAPSVLPERWADMAAAAGLGPGSLIAKLGCSIDDVTLPHDKGELEVRAVTPQDARQWAGVTLRGFGFPLEIGFEEMAAATATDPRFRAFAAWDDREMVAAGILFLHGKTGSLNAGSTLANHRNSGARTALIAARIAAARQAGCTRIVAETGQPGPGATNPSFDNLRRFGLKSVYARQDWVWQRRTQANRPSQHDRKETKVPSPSAPGRLTTADVLSGVDLTGRRALVTGASSGLGEEIARALTSAGAEVTLAVRNTAAGEAAADRIAVSTGRTQPAVVELDLMSPASITAAAAAWSGPLHILVANAGIMVPPEARTADGWESQFMTNYLGHYALITRLLPALVAAKDARVVLASSNAHLLGPVVVDALAGQSKPYEPWSAYAVSKTALILFAVEANRRWAAEGVTVSAYNPGYIRTGLQKNLPADMQVSTAGAKTLEEGAATPVFLAAAPDGATAGGKYFEDVAEAAIAVDEERDMSRPETFRGVASFALDDDTAAELWAFSERATRNW